MLVLVTVILILQVHQIEIESGRKWEEAHKSVMRETWRTDRRTMHRASCGTFLVHFTPILVIPWSVAFSSHCVRRQIPQKTTGAGEGQTSQSRRSVLHPYLHSVLT